MTTFTFHSIVLEKKQSERQFAKASADAMEEYLSVIRANVDFLDLMPNA